MARGALVTVRETASVLGVSLVQVLDLADSGRLASDEIDGQTFISRPSLYSYIATLSEGKQ